MQLHHRLSSHLRRHREKLLIHVKKHHKKYLFGTGMAFAIGAMKIMAITGVFLGIQMNTGKSEASYQKSQITNIIDVTNQINTLAHQFIDDRTMRGEIENPEMVIKFNELDTAFHKAGNLNEKYREAKKMESFFDRMDKYLHKTNSIVTDEDIQKDHKYHELKYELDHLE